MNKPDLNNPDTAVDLPADKREIIKQMQAEFKAFNEQQKLFERLHGTIYDGFLHPKLDEVFLATRKLGNSERLAEKQNGLYFLLMRVTSLTGLNFHQMAMVFNFIEGLSAQEANQCGIDEATFLEVFEVTYNESAMNVWNKQVDVWREEIGIEKQELVNRINKLVDELNKETAAQNKSRKNRKKAAVVELKK